ncbi:MAG TPA: tyrosine-type recombinase/integrase [Isosphaeraceae bacterium]|nr:tyrosine-type recombinase/integrase [Isosphaeraceae bacterium]
MRRRPSSRPRHCHSEEDKPAGSVRDHRADPRSIQAWLPKVDARNGKYLFLSRFRAHPHLSTRQYARIVHAWVESAGLDGFAYGTHSMRRTKAAQIYKKTGNLRAVQLLLGHTKLESTVRYLGIEVDDALSISEQVEL